MRISDIPSENVGFDIVSATLISDRDVVVLGKKEVLNENTGIVSRQFVTWMYNKDGGFYWGHYFDSKEKAFKDYIERINQ